MEHDTEKRFNALEKYTLELEKRIFELEKICLDLPKSLKQQEREKKEKQNKRQKELDALAPEVALLTRCDEDPKEFDHQSMTPELKQQALKDRGAHWIFKEMVHHRSYLQSHKKCFKCNLIMPGTIVQFV
jgi:hypothetical protein